MANFWETRRLELDLSQRAMASRLSVSNTTIGGWERDEVVPSCPIETLSRGYEAPESVIETEVMAQRRRIEARQVPSS